VFIRSDEVESDPMRRKASEYCRMLGGYLLHHMEAGWLLNL